MIILQMQDLLTDMVPRLRPVEETLLVEGISIMEENMAIITVTDEVDLA